MAVAVTGKSQVGEQIAKALGLDASKLSSLDISIEAGSIITVTAIHLPTELELGKLIPILKKYYLTDKPVYIDGQALFEKDEKVLFSTKEEESYLTEKPKEKVSNPPKNNGTAVG